MSAQDFPANAVAERLQRELAALQCDLDAATRQRLVEYLRLLTQWNGAYNLTAVRDPLRMVERHLIDSLTLLPYLQPGDYADVGTGPGIPGLVLALLDRHPRVLLVDSNRKMVRFLRECLRQFPLPHVSVYEGRVEALQAPEGYSQILSRAFADLPDFIRLTRHLLAPGGRWLAMKGKYPDAEVAALPADVELQSAHRLISSGDAAERHLLVLRLRHG